MTAVEFQAIVLAAGPGSRMLDLTSKIPKALLPVGNIPMIMYSLLMLENAGFEEAIVVVLDADMPEVKKSVTGTKLKLDYVGIPAGLGTAESLYHLKDKIKTDVMVISADLISDVSLQNIANVHRKHDSSLTVLYSPLCSRYRDTTPPGVKMKNLSEKDFVGLDESGERILYVDSEAEMPDNVVFRKSVLKKHPFMSIKSSLTDCHLYVMKKSLVDFITDKKSFVSLKEWLPYLVKKQFSKESEEKGIDGHEENQEKQDLSDYIVQDEWAKNISEMSSWNDHRGDMDDAYHGNRIRCYAYIHQEGLCVRENTLAAYAESNKQIIRYLPGLLNDKNYVPKHPSVQIKDKSQIGADCVLGEGVTIGEKTSIKKSVIGKNCKIGDKVKITNCVIMDNVAIAEGCNLQGSVVGNQCVINEKSELKDCVVGSEQDINAMGKFTNEAIVEMEKLEI